MLKKATLAGIAIAMLMAVNACHSLSKEQKTAARDTLKALRKLDAALQVGTSYAQFSPLVVEAQAQVNEAKAVLPKGELRRELTSAMEAYADAREAWGYTFDDRAPTSSIVLPDYRKKYPEIGEFTYTYEQLAVRLGEIGHNHLERADNLLRG